MSWEQRFAIWLFNKPLVTGYILNQTSSRFYGDSELFSQLREIMRPEFEYQFGTPPFVEELIHSSILLIRASYRHRTQNRCGGRPGSQVTSLHH